MYRTCPAEHLSLTHLLRPTLSRLQGLFFFHTRKVGLLAGIKFGRGFLIERQSPPDEQPARWSAPVFYTVQEGSFGLTAGAMRQQHAISFAGCEWSTFKCTGMCSATALLQSCGSSSV